MIFLFLFLADWQTLSNPTTAKSMAFDVNGDVLLWIEAENRTTGTLYWSRLGKNGYGPAQALDRGENWFINWADFPKFARNGSTFLVSWLEQIPGDSPYAYGVRIRLSVDSGGTWGPAQWLHTDLSPGEHGFPSFTPEKEGFRAVWLDGRHMHGEEGDQTLVTRWIGPQSLGPEQILDDRTCECCTTAIASQGNAYWVAYRDRSAEEIRDIAIFHNGEATIPFPDHWQITGCPVNGPQLAFAGSSLGLIWFEGSDQGKVSFAQNHNGTWSERRVLSVKSMGRLALTASDTTFYAAWLDFQNNKPELRVVTIGPEVTILKVQSTSDQRKSGFPRLTVMDGTLILATQTDSGIQTEKWSQDSVP